MSKSSSSFSQFRANHYFKVGQKVITKSGSFENILVQGSAKVISKQDRDNYFKVGQILFQSGTTKVTLKWIKLLFQCAAVISKWGITVNKFLQSFTLFQQQSFTLFHGITALKYFAKLKKQSLFRKVNSQRSGAVLLKGLHYKCIPMNCEELFRRAF